MCPTGVGSVWHTSCGASNLVASAMPPTPGEGLWACVLFGSRRHVLTNLQDARCVHKDLGKSLQDVAAFGTGQICLRLRGDLSGAFKNSVGGSRRLARPIAQRGNMGRWHDAFRGSQICLRFRGDLSGAFKNRVGGSKRLAQPIAQRGNVGRWHDVSW